MKGLCDTRDVQFTSCCDGWIKGKRGWKRTPSLLVRIFSPANLWTPVCNHLSADTTFFIRFVVRSLKIKLFPLGWKLRGHPHYLPWGQVTLVLVNVTCSAQSLQPAMRVTNRLHELICNREEKTNCFTSVLIQFHTFFSPWMSQLEELVWKSSSSNSPNCHLVPG